MKRFITALILITVIGHPILLAQQWLYPTNNRKLVATSPDKNFWHVQEVYNELIFLLERNDGTPLFQKKIRLEEPIYLPNTISNAIYSNSNQLISVVEKSGVMGQYHWLFFEQDTLGNIKTSLRIDAQNFYTTTSTDGSIFISNYQGLTKVRNGIVEWTKSYKDTSINLDMFIGKVLQGNNDSLTLFANNTMIRTDSVGNVAWSISYFNFAPPSNGSMYNAWHDSEYNIYFSYVNAILKLDYTGNLLNVAHTPDVQLAEVMPWREGSFIGIPYNNTGGSSAAIILIDSLFTSALELSIIDSTQGTIYVRSVSEMPNLVSIDGTFGQSGIYRPFKYTVPDFFDLCYAKATPIQMQISTQAIITRPTIVDYSVTAPIQNYIPYTTDTVLAPVLPEDFCLLNTNGQSDLTNERYSVYPNPTSGVITVTPPSDYITIYNNVGNVLVYATNTSVVDISNLSKGIYYFKITSSNKSSFHKVIIQ